MQTLRTGCSKAEQKIFATLQTPFPGARDGQNLISWRWSLQTQFGEDRCMQFRVIAVTDPQTKNTYKHTNPQTGPITIHCAAASCFSFMNDASINQSVSQSINQQYFNKSINNTTPHHITSITSNQ